MTDATLHRFASTDRAPPLDAPLHAIDAPFHSLFADAAAPPAVERGIVRIDVLPLRSGAVLHGTEIAWQSIGEADAPVAVVLGGISAGRACDAWWPAQCGVGRALDPRALRLIGVDWLGGADASTGPRGDAAFPAIDADDQACAILAVLDALGVARVALAVGASYGGCVALHLARRLGARLDRLVVVGAAHRPGAWAGAVRALQRADVAAATDSVGARAALVRARTLAMLAYRTPEELDARFGGGGIDAWLQRHGERFADRFDAIAFLRLSASLDAHRVDARAIATPATLVAIRGDLIVPPSLVRALAAQLGGPAEVVEIDSLYGHDAFLKEADAIGAVLRDAVAAVIP